MPDFDYHPVLKQLELRRAQVTDELEEIDGAIALLTRAAKRARKERERRKGKAREEKETEGP